MKNVLQAFYQPSEAEFKAAWADAIFVLDTNILLNLYRYPLQPRDELLTILKELGDRIWIPFHVGLEYQRNRLNVIIQQQARFTEIKNELTTAVSGLRGRIGGKKQHSIINVEPVLKQMEELVQKFNESLAGLQASDVVTVYSDPIREALDSIFAGRIGPQPDEGSLEDLKKKANLRYSLSIPPGYEDASKGKRDIPGYTFGGNQYESKHGDFIIWSQLMEHAKQKKISKVIFLTDDEKEDWCQVTETSSGKKKEPRVELVDEIRREANVTFFYLYNSESFLKYSKQYLKATVQDTSITQVADVLNLQRPALNAIHRQHLRANSDVSKVVLEWLDQCRSYLLQSSRFDNPILIAEDHTVDVHMVLPADSTDLRLIIADLLAARFQRHLIRPNLLVVVLSEDLVQAADVAIRDLDDLDPLQSVVFGELRRRKVMFSSDSKKSEIIFMPRHGLGSTAIEVM